MADANHHTVSRRTLLQGSAGLAAAGLAGFPAVKRAAAQDETPQEGGTLTISISQITSNSHMLHLRHYAGSENVYTRLLANARLVTLDNAQTAFVGALAETFEFSGNNLTFNLRPGLTWHDGEPFTAADVDFTYHMIGIPGVGPTLFGSTFNDAVVGMREYIDGTAERIAGLTVVDDLTVTFELFEGINQTSVLSLFN